MDEFVQENFCLDPVVLLLMKFTRMEEFKDVVKNYCINEGKVCRFRPSELKRVRVVTQLFFH